MAPPTPTEIKKSGATEVTVHWDDNHTSIFNVKYLRCECGCASCVSEVTGERILDPDTVPEDITITGAQHVGNYGVQFHYGDGHSTGIYTWSRLRELCPCARCRAK